MNALVVYDSVFGNTEKIALAVGEVLGAKVVKVTDLEQGPLSDVDVLVVGSPTRGFAATPALSAWLKGLAPQSLQGVRATAFDTRIDANTIGFFLFRWLVRTHYAVRPLEALLKEKGALITAPPDGFYVNASEGPLREGELERAAAWAKSLLQA